AVTTYAVLRERFTGDREPKARLERALDEIGWRAADGLSSEEVADVAVEIVRECVQSHRDVSRATYELADLLRAAAAMLDGGSMPTAMFVPAAEEVLQLYAGNRI
ncbi:MAG: hypothetical protein ABIY52_01340, partial [Gemmatimonadaceae bacterium]